MMDARRTYHQFLAAGFSKGELDTALHQFTLLRLGQLPLQYKTIIPLENHLNSGVPFFRKSNIRKLLSGKALSLIQSQFAKKPKNPV